jgi:hypothetical protein
MCNVEKKACFLTNLSTSGTKTFNTNFSTNRYLVPLPIDLDLETIKTHQQYTEAWVRCQYCSLFLVPILFGIGESRSNVADPDPGSGAFLTPGSGINKKLGYESGMNNTDHISKSLKTIFLLKYLNSLMRSRDSGWKKFGSGIIIPYPQQSPDQIRFLDLEQKSQMGA